MPFTVSHVAAVLPAHRWLSRLGLFTAAVIGSMVPDFGVILFHGISRLRTHSAQGLLLFCLPVGLAVFAATQYLIKPAVTEVLPDAPRERILSSAHDFRQASPLAWIGVAAAIVLGAATHLVWDGFTHEGAKGVRMFPVLDEVGPDIDGHALRVWRLLQYGSSVLGLAAVGAAVYLWLRGARRGAGARQMPRRFSDAERRWWGLLYTALPVGYLIAAIHRHGMSVFWPPIGPALGLMLYALMRGVAASLLLVSALIVLRLHLGRRPAH